MRFDIITIFPEMFSGVFSEGVVRKAIQKGLIEVKVHDLRDYTTDKHRQVDDRPFGGEEGMVFKPEPLFAAVEAVRTSAATPIYLLSPQGRTFDGRLAEEMAARDQIVLICGRYEGVDERVGEHLATEEISIGDYVLTGGEIPAMAVVDSVSRFVPGVVGKAASVRHDSFIGSRLDFPHYTRPRTFRGHSVPAVLFSGDHKKIETWRRRKALEKTARRRPDLLTRQPLTTEERHILAPGRKERNET
ncbi:MAG: tRNA (guanosine(37)-N1)-methyltransferase TrmD [Candidatus Aminicenantes bacterium]|nr:tRNA (guanosine(37)-N1)-methyltransferase TrmD [Candidatus Aminicenantes bacterium]